MRQDIEFDAEGTTLRGWLYVPDGASGPAPTIVMCHGFSAVKEMYLDAFAEVFCDAGLRARWSTTTATSARATASRGRRSTRGRRCATTATRSRTRARATEVDGDRIGVWGSSYSGAHVLVVGAIDRRVKCVVAQVPLISGHENARRLVRADLLAPTREMFDADREARYRGEAPAMIPVVAPEGEPCALPTPDSYEWFTRRGADARPGVAQRGARCAASRCSGSTSPARTCRAISPTPLLMVVAAGDHLTVADLAIDAFERAREPKRLEILPGGHFDAYIDGLRALAAARRATGSSQHLTARGSPRAV